MKIHVLWSYAEEVSRKAAGVKWCFKCHDHLRHDWVVFAEPFPSYYEPHGRYDCARCHEEHVLFPGREWAWTE